MKVFPEYFDFNQFEMARENMHTIKRPYINFGKTINFKFQEYNTNVKLQTVYWHRLIRARERARFGVRLRSRLLISGLMRGSLTSII